MVRRLNLFQHFSGAREPIPDAQARGFICVARAFQKLVEIIQVPPPEPAWGSMHADGRSMLMVGDWWLTIFPGICIMLVVLATQIMGDWLRIRLDPQLRNL